MRLLPALDLRDGACVQLVGGRYEEEPIRLPDPLGVSRRWAECGLREQHVVDLDRATARGSNLSVIEALCRRTDVTLQVGGGARDDDAVARLFDLGVARVVVGTRGVLDPPWLERISARWPGRVVLAVDVRGRAVVVHGWATNTRRSMGHLLSRVIDLPLAAVLVTAVHVEGTLGGVDAALCREVVHATRVPTQAAGGVGGVEDLVALHRCGVAYAIVGMALYTGRVDPRRLPEELAR